MSLHRPAADPYRATGRAELRLGVVPKEARCVLCVEGEGTGRAFWVEKTACEVGWVPGAAGGPCARGRGLEAHCQLP